MFEGKERRAVEQGEMLFEKIVCTPGKFEEIMAEDFKNLSEAISSAHGVVEAKPRNEDQIK